MWADCGARSRDGVARAQKRKEVVHVVSLHEIDVINSRQQVRVCVCGGGGTMPRGCGCTVRDYAWRAP